MTKVSVIVPVYNIEHFLSKCLDSICGQSLQDIEIICINDCSLDNSLHILNQYSKKDKRVKVVDFDVNKGVSFARNYGIDLATSEYISFVDGDDYIDMNFLNNLYHLAKNKDADIAKGEVKEYVNGIIQKDMFNINDNVIKNSGKLYFYTYWWSALYRRELLIQKNIRFLKNLSNGEDGVFLTEVLRYSNKIVCDNDVFYHYVRRENSADSKMLTSKALNSLMSSYSRALDLANLQVEDSGYISFYFFYIQNTIKNVFRTDVLELKINCILQMLDFYNKSLKQSKLLEKIKEEFPLLCEGFEKKDADFLKSRLLFCSYNQFMANNFRAKLIKAKGEN